MNLQKKLHSKTVFYFVSSILIIVIFVIAPPSIIFGADCGQPGNPAIQLMPSVGLGVLRDTFCRIGTHESSDPKPQLTIVNKANATLSISLTSDQGVKYNLKMGQGTDNTWSVKSGTYRMELSIPGYPSMSGGDMVLEKKTKYRWEIKRSEL